MDSRNGSAASETAFARDVPASCSCEWSWRSIRWVRTSPDPACGWHTGFSGTIAPTGR